MAKGNSRGEDVRLDKFLQLSRLVKRRMSAREACRGGRVQVNGRIARPGREVKVGDEITLIWGRKALTVKVLALPERSIPASQAKTLYSIIGEESLPSPEHQDFS
ncbi:MAG: S4 domain-containing RNA-binding protein [Thermacetogenium phaeum]|uniref:RQC P-site tRNA stabilizing factor n=1 Tax=Thermacetogenium phaeum TaxID=85874 RepID=A0A101FG93_9THEO|nr:MAG: S4 domain-containing RNA-binding protein [Thermacetogenium phaeum]